MIIGTETVCPTGWIRCDCWYDQTRLRPNKNKKMLCTIKTNKFKCKLNIKLKIKF